MRPLHQHRESQDGVPDIRSRENKCLSQGQNLLFLSHNEKRTSRGIAISHAPRWQVGWKQRIRKTSAQQQALYARSLVGWNCQSSSTMDEATVAKSGTGSTDSQTADQEDDEVQVRVRTADLGQEDIQRNMRKFRFRWRVAQSPPPLPGRIDPPDRVREIDIVLQQAFNWTQGSFSASWNSQIQNYPYIFDIDRRAEVLRDSFLIVSDLLELRQTTLAFRALNDILDSIPRYFVNAHPSLFLCLVELCLGTNMPRAPVALQKKVKEHVAEIARVVLGPSHPISVLLSLSFSSGDRLYISELVIKCLTDAMVNIFGEDGYISRFYEIAAAQNYAQTGRIREAEFLFTKVINRVSLQFGSETAFAGHMEFELSKIYQQSPSGPPSFSPRTLLEDDPHPAFLKVERAFDAYILDRASQLQRQSPGAVELTIPAWRIDLARCLFHRRRFALALHLYGSGCFEELSFYNPQVIDSADILLADRVADTVRCAFLLEGMNESAVPPPQRKGQCTSMCNSTSEAEGA